MASGHLTETLLRLATSRQNAAAIAGDLVESNASSSSHLLTVLRMYADATWRYAAGALLGIPLSYGVFRIFALVLSSRVTGDNLSGNTRWLFWAFMLTFAATAFSFVAALSFSRFGWRNRITRTSLGMALVCVASGALTWMPHSSVLLGACALAASLAAIAMPSLRKALLIPCATAALFAATFAVAFWIGSNGLEHHMSLLFINSMLLSSWLAAELVAAIALSAWNTRIRLLA